MYDQLPIILQLQEVDGEIDKLADKKKRIPTELRALDAELAKHKEILRSQNEVLVELQKKRRSKDRQLIMQQDQLEKYKSQRLSVKTNKEYAALESEITDLEEANSTIEDEILELMISIDEGNDALEAAKKELKVHEDTLKKEKDEFLSEAEELDRKIAEWTEKRIGFVELIAPALMNRYNTWRMRRGSSLVAVIVGQSCGGCHLTLPPQLINEVRKKQDLHNCNSCGRILYWRDEESEADE